MIDIIFDKDCRNCAKGFKRLNRLSQRNLGAYGSRKDGKAIKGITLIPDYNSAGALTHWHIK